MSVVSLPEPSDDDEGNGREEEEPADDDEDERGTVLGLECVVFESVVGDTEADDHQEEGEGSEESGEQLVDMNCERCPARDCSRTHGKEEAQSTRTETFNAVKKREEG